MTQLFACKQNYVVESLLKNNIAEDKIMVLTPYRAQIDCMKEKMEHHVEITTIHGSQG